MSEKTQFSGFTQYKQLVIELTNSLEQLKGFSEKMKLCGNVLSIDDSLQRLKEDTFSVAIIGEFKRGKSTLINALLGKDVLPTDVLPTTATLNKITYGLTPFVVIEYKDGTKEEIDIDKLNDYVTKLTKESEEKARTVKEAVVHYPINYCKNGITIIDTPGLNDDAAMTEVTMEVLPQIDAALMVVMAQSPFSESERNFLETKVINSDLGRVLFVVTGIDLLDEEDVDRVLNNITNRIQEHIMTKAEKTFGKESEEYQKYISKIGKVRVFGLSARNALRGKMRGDDEMLAKSCFPEFETALERFLTEDRGAVMLNVPVNRIKSASVEIAKTVQLRENALAMKTEEFNEKYQEAIKLIEATRDERQDEFKKINQTSQETYSELLPSIRDFWRTLESAAFEAVDNFPVDSGELGKERLADTQERLSNVVTNAIQRAAQNESERIQEKINQALEHEAERMTDFENRFSVATEQIQAMFIGDSSGFKAEGEYNVIAGAAANYFLPGIGSAYAGYKQAGWKGALLGGGAGFAGAIGTGVVITMLGFPLAWPALIIAAAVGMFTGTKMVSKMFGGGSSGGEDIIYKFKDAARESVINELERAKRTDDYSEKVQAQIKYAFEGLKERYKTETDRIMEDTQAQLTQLKIDKAKENVVGEAERADLAEMLQKIDAICTRANVIEKELTAVLTREVV